MRTLRWARAEESALDAAGSAHHRDRSADRAILALTVNPNRVFLCAFFGAGLTFAGSTGWCGLAILLSKMPWNRVSGKSCGSGGSCSVAH